MNRQQTNEQILTLTKSYSNILIELPTGFGKSKIAIDIAKEVNPTNILIVVPRNVLKGNWQQECKKWGLSTDNITFVTYVSFPKKIGGKWDLVIFDEAHHLSERCRDHITEGNVIINRSILLSATVSKTLRVELNYCFSNLYTYKVSMRKAIESDILPDPTVYLIPLELDNKSYCFETIKGNKKAKLVVYDTYQNRWKYKGVKDKKVIIQCTQKQYYDEMSSLIAWYKTKMYVEAFKNLYLQECGKRIKWLSNQKTHIVFDILNLLKDKRTLTFCNSIEQTELLGKYCINSKNKQSRSHLLDFNEGTIKHITACNMLDEGVNLMNCQIGIYAVLNSSERMIKQKMGRLLRHKEPILIIPYFKNTRDEEIVNKMTEDYNPENIKVVNDLKDIC